MKKDRIARARSPRIALVESDDLIRALTERWLEEAGCTIQRMTLDDLKRGNGIDLIIANVPKPREAALWIGSLRPLHRAPVLLISARFRRGQGASAALARQLGASAVLPKPFTRDELLTAVARALAASAPTPPPNPR